MPVECLVSAEDVSGQSHLSQHMVFQLTNLLHSAKEAFLEPRVTRIIVDRLRFLVEKVSFASIALPAVLRWSLATTSMKLFFFFRVSFL